MNTNIENRTIDQFMTRVRTSAALSGIRQNPIFLLRLSLAAVFFWFGILKVVGVSPVLDLLHKSFPILSHSPYLQLLGLGEMVIGIGLVVNRFASLSSLIMVLHLLATLTVVLVSPGLVFAPEFPVLTMEGEFITKNIVLITSGLVILYSNENTVESAVRP